MFIENRANRGIHAMRKILLIATSVCLFTGTWVNAQPIITTIAGNGMAGSLGDGGPATLAEVENPYGVAVDCAGNVYIINGGRIRKVSAAGTISTIAGNGGSAYSGDEGPAVSAELNLPYGVAVDASGNVYIADSRNQRIRKVSTTGIITTIAGNGYFSNTGASTGGYSGDGGAAVLAELNFPTGVALDGSGNVYIADEGNSRIRKVSPNGIISTIAGNGTYGYSGDGGPATSAALNEPWSIAVDASGNVYVADKNNQSIRKINTNGIISTIAGNGIEGYSGDGGPAVSAELYLPIGIAVDASGNVYIADEGNNRIRKVTTSGIISTIAGNGTSGYSGDGGPAVSAELYFPYGVAVDGSGNVYIADEENNRVRKVTIADTLPLTAGMSSSGIGCQSINAIFRASNGIPPYTFTYQLNGITQSPVMSTNVSDSVLLSLQNNIVLGTYTCSLISVKDGNPCSSPITITNQSAVINVYPKPNALFSASPQQTTILTPVINIVNASAGANSYIWNFGDSSVAVSVNPLPHTYKDTGSYTIQLITSTQAGCTDTSYQTVTITQFSTLYIPNAFTPNGDGKNEEFMPKGEGISNFEMTIYDRWGNMLFQTTDITKGWDGKANGGSQIAQPDTYVYVINLTNQNNGHDYTYNGTFNLMR